jgi:hypothetical protein
MSRAPLCRPSHDPDHRLGGALAGVQGGWRADVLPSIGASDPFGVGCGVAIVDGPGPAPWHRGALLRQGVDRGVP